MKTFPDGITFPKQCLFCGGPAINLKGTHCRKHLDMPLVKLVWIRLSYVEVKLRRMKCFILFVVSVLIFSACGRIEADVPTRLDTHSPFAAELQYFVDEARARHRELEAAVAAMPARWGETTKGIAECRIDILGNREIVVSHRLKAEWARYNESFRLSLMLHELGHCVLNRAHHDQVQRDGAPESLMNSTMPTAHFAKNPKAYLDELFNNVGEGG